jgi:hypothetical protein
VKSKEFLALEATARNSHLDDGIPSGLVPRGDCGNRGDDSHREPEVLVRRPLIPVSDTGYSGPATLFADKNKGEASFTAGTTP